MLHETSGSKRVPCLNTLACSNTPINKYHAMFYATFCYFIEIDIKTFFFPIISYVNVNLCAYNDNDMVWLRKLTVQLLLADKHGLTLSLTSIYICSALPKQVCHFSSLHIFCLRCKMISRRAARRLIVLHPKQNI